MSSDRQKNTNTSKGSKDEFSPRIWQINATIKGARGRDNTTRMLQSAKSNNRRTVHSHTKPHEALKLS